MFSPHEISILGVVAAFLFVGCTWLYRKALPKPIPGIPYRKGSEKRLLGDAPDLLAWRNDTKEVFSFMRKVTMDMKAPVIQLFMRPLGRPWVIITDFREAFDICATRKDEFDRSALTGEVFGPIVPNSHIQFPTDDHWRANRGLMRDTMSSTFIKGVIGPGIYRYASGLVSLWHTKASLANGRPFAVDRDVARCMVDFITSAAFGYDVKAIQTHEASLFKTGDDSPQISRDDPITFGAGEETEACSSLRRLAEGVAMAVRSPFPKIVFPLALRFVPYYSSALRYTNNMIMGQADAAWKRFSNKTASNGAARDEPRIKSAMELLVQREAQMARREKREAKFDLPVVRDELLAFLFAGQVTTGATIGWVLKYLTMYQGVQKRLREELRKAHERAVAAGDRPTAEEIYEANIPYLDAFFAESHRFAVTISCMVRYTTKDVVILGYHVPKGTDVFMLTNGPGYQLPPMPMDEALRSTSSQEAKDKYGTWDDSDVAEFRPERWLETREDGELRYNALAGPSMPFGVGPRGCFGNKWATLVLKTIVTLGLWDFELMDTPLELSGIEASDGASHSPQKVYVRLKELRGQGPL